MTDNNRREGCSLEITSNLMNMEPTGVMYQIYGARIAETLNTYLANKGIDARIVITLDSRNNSGYKDNPEHVKPIKAFATVDIKSEYVKSNTFDVAPQFKDKFIQGENVQFTEEFNKALFPFAKNGERDPKKPFKFITGKRSITESITKAYIQLDIFKIFSFLLNAPVKKYGIQILETKPLVYGKQGKDCIIQVMKLKQFPNSKTSNEEERMIAAFESLR